MRLMQWTLAAISLCAISASVMASPVNPVGKVDYQSLDKTVPTEAGSKVEVTEFFSYTCPHCNAFDPELTAWVKSKGNSIVFKRVPVQIHEGDVLLQKLYYALDAMGIADQLHGKVFQAIHVQHKQFADENQIADFVAGQGIDRAKFIGVFDSFGVQTKLQRGNQLAELYKITGVPLLAIDGRFESSPEITTTSIGNKPQPELFAATLKISDWLVAKVLAERKPQTAALTAKPASATGVAKK